MSIKSKLSKTFYSILTLISPKLNASVIYKRVHGKRINLKKPQTLEEKLLWLKINDYSKNDLVIKCADKYLVRDYVKECSCEDILNDLIAVYEKPEDICWDELPEKFALKWNFGAGMNIICKNKFSLNKSETVKKLSKWGKTKYWLPQAEMHYKYITKRIVCEKFLEENEKDSIADYKVYCFHGEPIAILVMNDRGKKVKAEFFDVDWNALETSNKYEKPDVKTDKPICFEKMLEVSKKLSKPFPFVRCDYYVINDKLYFGEMTFTPAGGMHLSKTTVNGKDMSEFLNIHSIRGR